MAASAQCQHSTGRRRRLPAPANLSKTRVSRLKKKPQSFHVKTHHLTATHKSHAPRHSGASKYKVRNGKRDRRICTAREAVRGGGERREGKLLVVATRHRRRGGRSGEREREGAVVDGGGVPLLRARVLREYRHHRGAGALRWPHVGPHPWPHVGPHPGYS
jgi:hypothetical protein